MSSANVSSDEKEATPSVEEEAEAEVEKPEVKEGMCVLGVITNKIEPWFYLWKRPIPFVRKVTAV